MTLGENICRLRKERGMSQGDLADRLGVSRQSVSKWETNGSVPDLDKLVVMSRLFGVTLDQLVCGEEPAGQQEEEPEPPRSAGPAQSRQVVGGVLLGVGLLGLLLLLFLTGLDGLPLGLLFLLPFLLCGVLCLRVNRRLGLWCAWAVYLP
ncbi:helix-turn-helix transcriptional regulator [Pseudoflavonifractor phocaeensis]|uniref:helix-turn-helix transcriptional regulator n=1 Tax=Pseudoflavonifractor phocaeensis TaxID=1870988 RepID=UPI00195CB509|nr:helix-turn-helix transcriptional regulator [Pseudoflavonifractor phocaeensis]MBM6924937.1 helix-turn-helix transcriptional regulator [Pseudoflavonifractor phocaeensis]